MIPDKPKISIVMPSFNQGKFLEAAIQSVLSQDYPDKELIVIDGGSKDQSAEILRRYESALAFSVSEPDRGQAHALNKAMEHASGQIVGWLNSDDCYLPGALTRAAKAFRNNPDAILIHGDRLLIDNAGRVTGWSALPAFDPATTGYIICSETAFWLKSMHSRVQFDENLRFAMDLDYFGQLYRLGRVVKLNSYLGAFRAHPDTKSSTLNDVCLVESEKQWKAIFPEFPDGWKNTPKTSKARLLRRLLSHPFLIAFPYLCRRFCLGRQGKSAGVP